MTARLDRRHVLAGVAALAAALPATSALARAPLAGTQAAGVYRRKLGAIEVTALLDGHLTLERQLFPQAVAAPAEADALLERAFLPRTGGPSPVNAYLVNSGERTILIDTGTATAMGPGLGHAVHNLRAAGVTPEQVDAVLLTHMHPDHVNGLVANGQAVFPNAEVLVAEAEHAFWTDEGISSRAPAEVQPFFQMARAGIAPYRDRLRRFAPGGEVAPGITSIAAPGHTPGHTAFRVASGPEQLLIWGDVVHFAPWQFARPDWSLGFDVDLPAAAATRRRLFDQAAADRTLVAGMHLPFPGLGYVAKDGQGYAYTPEAWRPL